MKLLKKLAILTCALAAFSFVACDSGNNDDDEPNTPVVDEGGSSSGEEEGEEAGGKTITVAITADEARISGVEQVCVYLWSDIEETNNVFGEYPGVALTKDETLGIWSITKDVSVDGTWHVIFNDGSSNKVEGILIKPNESKLYTRARTWIDWDKTSADATEPYVEPVVPTEMSSEIIVLAVDVSGLNWADGAPYIWGWSGAWDISETNPLKGSFGSDDVKLTQLEGTNIWYFAFSKTYATDNGPHVVFVSNAKLADESDRIAGNLNSLEAGKGYLLKVNDGEWTTFTSFDELKSE